MPVELVADNGGTILLPFASSNQIQSIRFLLGSASVELNAVHHDDGTTSFNILLGQQRGPELDSSTSATHASPHPNDNKTSTHQTTVAQPPPSAQTPELINEESPAQTTTKIELDKEEKENSSPDLPAAGKTRTSSTAEEKEEEDCRLKKEWIKKMRGWVMVVASVIASMTYQAGLSTPGGFWQDDLSSTVSTLLPSYNSTSSMTSPANNVTGHHAGHSILREKSRARYIVFLWANDMAFTYAIGTIILLLKENFFHRESRLFNLRNIMITDMAAVFVAYSAGCTRDNLESMVPMCYLVWFFIAVGIDIWCTERRRARGSSESSRENLEP